MIARVIIRHAMAALQAIEAELSQLPSESNAHVADAVPAREPPSSPRQSGLLSVSDLSERLNLRKSTIYKLVCSRQIDHYKLGSRLLFAEKHVDAYLTTCERARIGGTARIRGQRRL